VSTQQHSPEWEDTIDLRKWIDALFRYKWLILACTVIAIAVATIFSYVIQTPTFKATGGASLPAANADGGLGLTLRGYQEFAASTPVMDAVSQKLGLQPDAGRLRAGYTFQLEKDERFITVTASAETAEQAFQLASRWIEAYDEQVQANIREQFDSLRDETNRQLEIITPELALAEDGLARFDLENPIITLEARIPALEAELSGSETQLRGLLDSSRMLDAGSLEYLEGTLPGGSGSVGGGGSPGAATQGREGAFDEPESIDSTINDSTYLELSQALARVRLSSVDNELAEGESRLRELTWSAIPIDEVRIEALEDAVEVEPRVLEVTQNNRLGASADSAGQGTLSIGAVVNPVYVALAKDLAESRVRLATIRREAETLEDRISSLLAESEKLRGRLAAGIPILRDQVKELRQQLADAKKIRSGLDREATKLRAAYEPAMAEVDRLLEIEPRLVTIASLSTIREPALPNKPVAPQRTRNISLAAVLGLMLGVFGAFFLEYYKTTSPAARPNDE
jgi:capsular polysaccharide biosynthesis protein